MRKKGVRMKKLYSIKDSKAGVFNTPFVQITNGEAERSLHRLVNDPQSMIAQYPEDYDLYYLGEFSETDGKMKMLDAPLHIISAGQFKKPTQLNA